jgi:hypothetical protein
VTYLGIAYLVSVAAMLIAAWPDNDPWGDKVGPSLVVVNIVLGIGLASLSL